MAPDESVWWAPRALGFIRETEPGLVGVAAAGARE